ncbi:hypothetical protein PS634_03876 [Pseudomonas fluorescens]|nr:hypothetical protein PS634_03876 [Pseudomonas fluorescens]
MTENMKIARLAAIAAILAAVIAPVVTPIATHVIDSYYKEKPEDNGTKNNVHPEAQVTVNSVPKSLEKLELDPKIALPDSKLGSIFIGMSKPYVETLFGTPIVELKHDFEKLTETNYVFDNFYLQFIFSKSGSLQFYSVVSRAKTFMPCIPTINKCLGNTFSNIAKVQNMNASLEHSYVYSYLTSKHYGYGEYLYLGNAGNYHNYYLGYNSLGVDYDDIRPFTLNEHNKLEWDEFRSHNMPNAFGVGNIGSISDKNLYYEIGPEFYTFRNL